MPPDLDVVLHSRPELAWHDRSRGPVCMSDDPEPGGHLLVEALVHPFDEGDRGGGWQAPFEEGTIDGPLHQHMSPGFRARAAVSPGRASWLANALSISLGRVSCPSIKFGVVTIHHPNRFPGEFVGRIGMQVPPQGRHLLLDLSDEVGKDARDLILEEQGLDTARASTASFDICRL